MIQNWTDFDLHMRAIAEIDFALIGYAIEREEAKLSADTVYKALSMPKIVKRDAIAEEMEIFFKAHKKEVDGRSKTLQFGRAGFRTSPPKLALRKGWKWDKVMDAIKAKFADWSPFVSTKEALNKEGLKSQLSEGDLAEVGLKLTQGEEFFIESYPDKVEAAA